MSARMLDDLSSACTKSMHGNEVDLVEACLTYFKVFGKKLFCYYDLQPFVHGFDSGSTQRFLEDAKLWSLREHRTSFGQDQARDSDEPNVVGVILIPYEWIDTDHLGATL